MSSAAKWTSVAYTKAIQAEGRGRHWDQALRSFQDLRPDVVSFTALLRACARLARWEVALSQLVAMESRKLKPDLIARNAALSACAEAMQWPRCLALLAEAADGADGVSCNAVLKAFEKSMQWERALDLYSHMGQLGKTRSLVTCNTVLSTCQKSGQWERTLDCFREMKELQILPDLISLNAVLGAAKRGAAWQSSWQLLEDAGRQRIRRDAISLLEAFAAFAESESEPSPRVGAALCELRAEVRDLSRPSLKEVERPLGLAVTVCDALLAYGVASDAPSAACLGRYVLRPVLRRLRKEAAEGEDSAVLERQHSLGAQLTAQALKVLAGAESSAWQSTARLAPARALQSASARGSRASEVSSSRIVAWLAHRLDSDSPLDPCRGRLGGAIAETEPSQWLRPVEVEHDRSSHAERQSLLALMRLEQRKSDFAHFSGVVRLYVTHTLCISCLAACFQYKELHPMVRLCVSFSVL
ncbi:unnamed protein product [Effrenium voratum]|uniref:Pentatricopeptide repeat-containing protein, chloroplastic n=1 Tax=Effrenium voratum TaxID=2562239 RepID=A0AA36NLN5_9DINO|nr:unnamed protein product [Effrenium voratum]